VRVWLLEDALHLEAALALQPASFIGCFISCEESSRSTLPPYCMNPVSPLYRLPMIIQMKAHPFALLSKDIAILRNGLSVTVTLPSIP
jgi:hypothetical protein